MRLLPTAIVTFSSLLFTTFSDAATYNVISVAGNNHTMGVIVNGKAYSLQPSRSVPVLYTGSAPAGTYSYAKLDKSNGVLEKEPFQRQWDQQLSSTPNEFYNRTWNTQKVAELPQLLDRLPAVHRVKSDLHARNQISTIYLSGDQQHIDLMHSNTSVATSVTVNLNLIRTDKVSSVKGVEIKVAGQSSKLLDKLSYGLKIPKGQDLFGYRRLKLRALRSDPSYIREILCYDMMTSMGVPVSGASYVRVIMNDQPLGLFLMIENYKNPWIANEFNDGKKMEHGQGATFQGAGLDLSYLGDNVTKYENAYKLEEDPDKKHNDTSSFKKVMDFTKFISEAPTTTPDAVKTWNKYIDMESVIRSLVIEIAAGFSDGYIANSNNYFLYDNLAEDRFTFLTADFDTTMGNTLVKLADQWSGNYSQYPGFSMRPLVQKLIQVPEFKSQFEKYLQKVAQQLIDPSVTNQRVEDLVKMIREDVQWDDTLPKMNKQNGGKIIGSPFGDWSQIVKTLPAPIYPPSVEDLLTRGPVNFDTAINGPTNHISLPGVKEWFQNQSKNIQSYFAQHPPQ